MENIIVVTICKLREQQIYLNAILNTPLKLMVNKGLRYEKMRICSKIMKENKFTI